MSNDEFFTILLKDFIRTLKENPGSSSCFCFLIAVLFFALNYLYTFFSIWAERKRMELRVEERGKFLDVERERKVSCRDQAELDDLCCLATRESRHLIRERQETRRLHEELRGDIINWGRVMRGWKEEMDAWREEVKGERGGGVALRRIGM